MEWAPSYKFALLTCGSNHIASDLDQGTFGVELEFLVVQCPKVKMDTDGKFVTVDQHPKDHRWLSTMLSSWEVDYMRKMRHREDIELYLDRNDTYCDYLNESGNERRSQYSRVRDVVSCIVAFNTGRNRVILRLGRPLRSYMPSNSYDDPNP